MMISKKIRMIIAFVLLVCFGAMIFPTLYIAQYNHPCEDDYAYGRATKNVYEETGSVVQTVVTAFKSANDTYMSWQGTYTGVLAMCSGPYIFNIEWYDACTYILLGFLILGTSFLTYKIVVSYFKADLWTYLIVDCIILMVSIELVPHPTHSFFWYNGSILYTSFYSIALIVYGLTIGLLMADEKGLWKRYLLLIPLVIIAGLGNTVISLNLVIVMTMFTAVLMVLRNKKYKRILPLMIVAVAALLVMILAPGSINRQIENEKTTISAISAILKSFVHAYNMLIKPNVDSYNKIFITLGAFAILPIMLEYIVKKDCKFKYPWIVLLISFCILSAMFTPPLYVFGQVISIKRVININYFASVWVIFINVVYIGGYLYRLIKSKQPHLSSLIKPIGKLLIVCWYSAIVMVSAITISGMDLTVNETIPLCARSAKLINNGAAKVFDEEYHERLTLLQSDEDIIVFEPYSYLPDLLFFRDLYTLPKAWPNKVIAKYYDKESVYVTEMNWESN